MNHLKICEVVTERGARLRALFPLCAMANSSCAPNLTSVMRRDGSLALVASRDIATGEEMTVCYTGTRYCGQMIDD